MSAQMILVISFLFLQMTYTMAAVTNLYIAKENTCEIASHATSSN